MVGMTARITSLANPTVKAVRALHLRKERDETGLFVAEGLKNVTEGVEQGHAPHRVAERERRRQRHGRAGREAGQVHRPGARRPDDGADLDAHVVAVTRGQAPDL